MTGAKARPPYPTKLNEWHGTTDTGSRNESETLLCEEDERSQEAMNAVAMAREKEHLKDVLDSRSTASEWR